MHSFHREKTCNKEKKIDKENRMMLNFPMHRFHAHTDTFVQQTAESMTVMMPYLTKGTN